MVDYTDPRWNEADSQNTAPSPNGLATGSTPSAVPAVIRAGMGAQTRNFNRINPRGLLTNSGNAYTLTYDVAPTGYEEGVLFSFFVNAANTGPATLSINGMTPKAVVQADGTALQAGDFVTGMPVTVAYDGTRFRMVTASAKPSFSEVSVKGKAVFTVDNDGAGSGLDADLVDGQEGTFYLSRSNHTGTQPANTVAGLGTNGLRNLTISTAAPTGGADGDVWYKI